MSLKNPNEKGRFGPFGGRYIPETLVPACHELEKSFVEAWADDSFREELDALGSTGPIHFSDSLKISSLPNSYLSHRPKRSAQGMILSITVTALPSVSLGKKRLMLRSSFVPLRMNWWSLSLQVRSLSQK